MISVPLQLVRSPGVNAIFFEQFLRKRVPTLTLQRTGFTAEAINYEAITIYPFDLVNLGMALKVYMDAIDEVQKEKSHATTNTASNKG